MSGQHTSSTDLPLTEEGEGKAAEVGKLLARRTFAAVYSSPMQRALDTCRIAGYEPTMVTDDLCEWNYGQYEGLTTPQIRKTVPGWTIWAGAPPGGETIDQVAERAKRIIAALSKVPDGEIAVFGHGHMLRVLAACWLQVDPTMGRCFALSTGSISVLGYERDTRVLERWNQTT